MFELYIARKYLLPRKHSFSTAVVSILSVCVIALVVWLILVFLSVTAGIEKKWLHKLTALYAPIRISPTDEYFSSYYYQIDRLSAASSYSLKTIGEKAVATASDPYNPRKDREVPRRVKEPDRLPDGTLKDPVHLAYAALQELFLPFQDYEMSGALLRVEMPREEGTSYLSQVSYLMSIADKNPLFPSLLLEPPVSFSEPGIFLSKGYKDNGVRVGDQATLSYSAPSAASVQEQRIPVRVSGFYDPGLLPLGGRCILAPIDLVRTIQASSQTFSPESTPTNGLFVWLDGFEKTADTIAAIEKKFKERGISSYWTITPYDQFEFSKDLFQQFKSDKTLFLFIAVLILLVAACNIIVLLVLLVHDKKKEIAILQSMGASPRSIAAIFALCGVAMGSVGSAIGLLAAFLTLKNLGSVVEFLSALQGHTAFHPAFLGNNLPSQLSIEAILFVLIATPLISLLAGLIPALRAIGIKPAETLRPE